jgi:transposase
MAKSETAFKLKVVKRFLAGDIGAKLLARRCSAPEEKIRTWVGHYRRHGIDGLRPKRSVYSAQFKLQVLSHQERERLSSRQVAAIYDDIRNPNQVVGWRRKFDTDGVAALENVQGGHPGVKPTRGQPVPPRIVNADSALALREGGLPKKLHALIRARRSVAPTKRASFSD